MTWVCFPRDSVSVTTGDVRLRRSSPGVKRAFCPSCGAQIYMDYDGSPTIDVSIGTLDEPDRIAVRRNIYVATRLSLMRGFDAELPDYRGFAEP